MHPEGLSPGPVPPAPNHLHSPPSAPKGLCRSHHSPPCYRGLKEVNAAFSAGNCCHWPCRGESQEIPWPEELLGPQLLEMSRRLCTKTHPKAGQTTGCSCGTCAQATGKVYVFLLHKGLKNPKKRSQQAQNDTPRSACVSSTPSQATVSRH